MRRRSEAGREEPAPEILIDAPGDPANEQVILGAMMLDLSLADRAPPDAFDVEEHRAIAAGLAEIKRRKLAFDPATLMRLAPDVDQRFVDMILAARPEAPNIDYHLEMLEWDRQRRQLTRGPLASLLEAVQDPKAEPDKVRSFSRQVAEMMGEGAGRARHLRDSEDVAREAIAEVRRRAAGEAHFLYGVSGFDADEKGERRFRPGAAPGLTTVLSGRSGNGKTTFTGHLILGLARQRRRVLVGAWEDYAPMTLELLAVLSLRWSRVRTLDGESSERPGEPLSEEELALFHRRMEEIGRWVTFIENPFRRRRSKSKRATNEEHLEVLWDHVAASGCDAAVFDLFDRCLIDRRPEDEQEALFTLQDMSKRERVHTIAVHQQLNKGERIRSDNRPSAENLKGSSSYYEIADYVFATHLPAKWKDVPDDKLEVLCLKQKKGPFPFAIEFGWSPETGQISGGRTAPFEPGTKHGRARDADGPKDGKLMEKARRRADGHG